MLYVRHELFRGNLALFLLSFYCYIWDLRNCWNYIRFKIRQQRNPEETLGKEVLDRTFRWDSHKKKISMKCIKSLQGF